MAHELAPIASSAPSILTATEFHRLADVPAEAEWFANIQNKHTRDAYRRDVSSFMRFVGSNPFGPACVSEHRSG